MEKEKISSFLKGYFAVFLVIVLVLAYVFIRNLGENEAETTTTQVQTDAAGSVLPTTEPVVLSGVCDILFGCGEGNTVDFLLRAVFDLDNRQVTVYAIPVDLTLSYGGGTASVGEVLSSGGAGALAAAIGGYYSDSFDRYYFCTPSAFQSVTRLLGSADIQVPHDVSYVREDVVINLQAGRQSLSGEDLYHYLTYADEGDALLNIQAEAMAAMLQSYLNTRNVAKGEALFSDLINDATSNITAYDYMNYQAILAQMAASTEIVYQSGGIAALSGGEDG